MKSFYARNAVLSASLALMVIFAPAAAVAQYKVTSLVSNVKNQGAHQDTNLVNAWGLARSPKSPFWVSDNGTGRSTLYDGQGVAQQLVVTIPSASATAKGSPSGIVFNGSAEFKVGKAASTSEPSIFLFATNDGLIAGWNPKVDLTHAVVAVDNAKAGSFYTGLAVTNHPQGKNFLFAADVVNNRVDIYDGNFNLVGNLIDREVPAGFAPYGIRDMNNQVFVTYASTGNATGGFVDIFSETGQLERRLISNGPLNQPWGLAIAPSDFGAFSNALLVSNNLPNGTINAFDLKTGKSLGPLKDEHGKTIVIDQIWGLDFGAGNPVSAVPVASPNGLSNQLFFTAGPNNYTGGQVGVIQLSGSGIPLN